MFFYRCWCRRAIECSAHRRHQCCITTHNSALFPSLGDFRCPFFWVTKTLHPTQPHFSFRRRSSFASCNHFTHEKCNSIAPIFTCVPFCIFLQLEDKSRWLIFGTQCITGTPLLELATFVKQYNKKDVFIMWKKISPKLAHDLRKATLSIAERDFEGHFGCRDAYQVSIEQTSWCHFTLGELSPASNFRNEIIVVWNHLQMLSKRCWSF